MATRTPKRGTVDEFDADVGLGSITAEDGSSYPFHLTAVADRTRSIDLGAAVLFDVVAGPSGRYEAMAIVKVSG